MTVDVSMKDIPQRVLDDVVDSLKHYLVALYVLLPESAGPRLRLIGSGTLIEIGGTYHILTAYHVWRETKGAENVGLVVTDYQSAFSVPRNSISEKALWVGQITEWGHDIALLRLAQPFASTIAARKSFLNLVQQKETLRSCPPVVELKEGVIA